MLHVFFLLYFTIQVFVSVFYEDSTIIVFIKTCFSTSYLNGEARAHALIQTINNNTSTPKWLCSLFALELKWADFCPPAIRWPSDFCSAKTVNFIESRVGWPCCQWTLSLPTLSCVLPRQISNWKIWAKEPKTILKLNMIRRLKDLFCRFESFLFILHHIVVSAQYICVWWFYWVRKPL